MMVGREVRLDRVAARRSLGPVVLEATAVAAPPLVRQMSLTVRAGEIVCLAGLIGAGRSEFCEAIFGMRRRTAGSVMLAGAPFTAREPRDAIRAGIGMVPEDRKHAGLFLDMSLRDNITVAIARDLTNGLLASRRKAEDVAQRFIGEMKIATPSTEQVVGNLSGGNQQKVLIAKWLATAPRLLIVDEPTRGVDVGARAEIYRLLRDLADKGVALVVVSSDLPEVLTRIAVIGCGFYAQNQLASWRDLGADLVAVCDMDTEKAQAAAATFGTRPYADPEAMLAKTGPDLVDIVRQSSATCRVRASGGR